MIVTKTDEDHNRNLSWDDITTDLESWLSVYQGGWPQEARITAEAHELGLTSELDFDLEDYKEKQWIKWLDKVNN